MLPAADFVINNVSKLKKNKRETYDGLSVLELSKLFK